MARSTTEITKQSAGLLLTCESRMLLLRRSRHVRNGLRWGLPGGRRERDEHPYETACREALEEVGRMPPFRVREVLTAHRNAKRYDVFVCRMSEVDRRGWRPLLDNEHTDHRWVTLKWAVRHLAVLHPVLQVVFGSELGLERVLGAMRGVVRPERVQQLLRRANAGGASIGAFALAA